MCQQRVLKLLKKYPRKWFDVKEVCSRLKLSQGVVSHNLNSLYNQGDIVRMGNIKGSGNYFFFRFAYNTATNRRAIDKVKNYSGYVCFEKK